MTLSNEQKKAIKTKYEEGKADPEAKKSFNDIEQLTELAHKEASEGSLTTEEKAQRTQLVVDLGYKGREKILLAKVQEAMQGWEETEDAPSEDFYSQKEHDEVYAKISYLLDLHRADQQAEETNSNPLNNGPSEM